MTELDLPTLNIALGLLIPFLVGIITRKASSSGVKAIANFALSAIVGGLTVVVQATEPVDTNMVVTGIFLTFVTSITSYYGISKPTGASEAVQDKTASFGI